MSFKLFFLKAFLWNDWPTKVHSAFFSVTRFLDPRLWPEGSYELGSVRLSFRPEVFLRLTHYFFLKFSMVLEAHLVLLEAHVVLVEVYVVLCVTEPDILKKYFSTKNRENEPKIGFLKMGISGTKWWKSLIFCILIQICEN